MGALTLPKLAVVTTSEEVLCSAVWTVLVLERIENTLEKEGVPEKEFEKRVRLITGASGDAGGGGLNVASLYNKDLFKFRQASRRDSGRRVERGHLPGDQPDQQLGRGLLPDGVFDIPAMFDIRGKEEDRGRALEATWVYLDQLTFGMLRGRGGRGRLPSSFLARCWWRTAEGS